MWWECLPSLLIIAGCIHVPQVVSWYFTGAVLGNPMKRDMGLHFDRLMFLRDSRIDGAPWKIRGLENIPDK